VYESEFEKNLYQQRRDKLEQIAAIGQRNGLTYAEATYPNSYAATHTIPELRAAYDSLTAEQLESAPTPIDVSRVACASRSTSVKTTLVKTPSLSTNSSTSATTSAFVAISFAPARAN
jgi:lysyl-tRNA synthetase class II